MEVRVLHYPQKYKIMNAFKKLMLIRENYPQLTFNNKGYEGLKTEIVLQHKLQIEEISEILKKEFVDFISFQNFKPSKDGGFYIRCQFMYDRTTYFKGVVYLTEKHFTRETNELI